MIDARTKLARSNAITAQLIRYDDPRCASTLHEFSQEPLSGFSVSARLHKDFERISVAIDRTSEPVLLPVDRDHNFVQAPLVGGLRSITSNLGRNWCSKFSYPISDRLMADRNAAFCQQIMVTDEGLRNRDTRYVLMRPWLSWWHERPPQLLKSAWLELTCDEPMKSGADIHNLLEGWMYCKGCDPSASIEDRMHIAFYRTSAGSKNPNFRRAGP